MRAFRSQAINARRRGWDLGTYVLVVAAVVGVTGDGRLVLAAGEVEDGAALGVCDLV